jgi:hypothetical protein
VKGTTTVTTDVDTFPSITFPATFEGTAAIGADFSATLKLKTSDGPAVLRDLKGLPRGTYDVTIVSRQGALDGDSTDREWANMSLQYDAQDTDELEYEPTCLGSRCPVFSCHSSGEFEGKYVCEHFAEDEAYMEVVYGETGCPRYASGEALPTAATVLALWPGDDEEHVTEVGPNTQYAELVADYLAAIADPDTPLEAWAVVAEHELADPEAEYGARGLHDAISPFDYGLRLRIVAAEQGK